MTQIILNLDLDKEHSGLKRQSFLLSEIKEGKSIDRIARNHNRSKGGVTARLQMIACKMLENDSDIREIMEKTQLT